MHARVYFIKVHLTPKIFFAKIIRLISWSNVAQKFFELVKSSNFYAPSKYVKIRPDSFVINFLRGNLFLVLGNIIVRYSRALKKVNCVRRSGTQA